MVLTAVRNFQQMIPILMITTLQMLITTQWIFNYIPATKAGLDAKTFLKRFQKNLATMLNNRFEVLKFFLERAVCKEIPC